MIKKILSAVALATTLTGCLESDDAMMDMAGMSLTTEQAFREAVVGKTLEFMGNTMVINGDGTISGPWDGRGITGSWEWRDGAWCRIVAIGSEERPEDCQLWSVDGNKATFTRDRGNGVSATYTIL